MTKQTPQPNVGMILALLFVLVFWTSVGIGLYVYYSEDYTDSGVGCVEDCLEPLTITNGD